MQQTEQSKRIPAEEYATREGVTTDQVIQMIKSGMLSGGFEGRLEEGKWFVDMTGKDSTSPKDTTAFQEAEASVGMIGQHRATPSLPQHSSGFSTSGFWAFKRMITPIIIHVIFWIGVVACIIGGIGLIGVGADQDESGLVVMGIALILVGPVVVRLYCELSILFFRMNETLTEIKNEMTDIKNGISNRPE